MLVEEVDHGDRCVGTGDRPGGLRHRRQSVWIVHEAVDFCGEPVGVEFTVGDKHRSTCVDECAGVGGLVIAGCARQGHEHAGKTGDSHFGDRRRPGSTDDEISGGVDRGHVIFVLDQLVGEGCVRRQIETLDDGGMISSPGDMSDRHRNSITPPGSGIRGGVIDPTGAQRPSEDREEDMVVRHAESPASTRPAVGIRGGKRPHLGADRVAGPDRVRQVDTLEGHGTGLREPPGQPVGSARYGVLLGDHDGHTPQHRSEHTRNRRVPAEADHDGRSKTAYQSDTGDDGGEQTED